MTTAEILDIVERAKHNYPVGTKFISLFGAKDEVEEWYNSFEDIIECDLEGRWDNSIAVMGKNSTNRVIYADGKWAEILK